MVNRHSDRERRTWQCRMSSAKVVVGCALLPGSVSLLPTDKEFCNLGNWGRPLMGSQEAGDTLTLTAHVPRITLLGRFGRLHNLWCHVSFSCALPEPSFCHKLLPRDKDSWGRCVVGAKLVQASLSSQAHLRTRWNKRTDSAEAMMSLNFTVVTSEARWRSGKPIKTDHMPSRMQGLDIEQCD
jgi:hypothetical protein